MVAVLSFMTSLAVVAFGLIAVLATLRGQGSKIVAALAGDVPGGETLPYRPGCRAVPRNAVRVIAPPYRALPEWRAAA